MNQTVYEIYQTIANKAKNEIDRLQQELSKQHDFHVIRNLKIKLEIANRKVKIYGNKI